MTVDLSQIVNADGTPLSPEQVAALTPAAPPVAPVAPAPELPVGPTAAERLVAIAQAGLDISSPLTAAVAETYKGDLADAEAIKAYAATLGWTAPAAPPAVPVVEDPTGGQAAARNALAATPGYVAPVEPELDPYQAMEQVVAGVRESGQSEPIQLQRGVQELIAASLNGDTRVSVEEAHTKRMAEMRDLGLVSNNS